MMKRFLYIIASLAFVSCSEKDSLWDDMPEDAMEMKGVTPCLTRSVGIEVAELADYVGRKEFSDQDVAVFTRVRRTSDPINQFNYKDLEFKCAVSTSNNITSVGWSRIPGKGTTEAHTEMSPDRIYWTDATNPHTFIGFCKPQQGEGEKAFDWEKYTTEGLETYFGSLGDPTVSGDIDYTSDINETTKDTIQGNEKICKDDILLTYSQDIRAEDAIARLRFHHGLAQVRVIVNISDFAAGGDQNSADKKSIVSDMVLKKMLTMYKWNQTDSTTQQLVGTDATALSEIYGTSHPAYNQRKDVKLWIRHPKGVGTGSNKIFTFYGLAVPTQIEEGNPLQFSFKVTYPDPMNPSEMQTKTYATSIHSIRFSSGKCTTINISLNHKNEKLTVGAEYDDWDFIESLDQGALKKNSTFLATSSRNSVTILGDEKATADDATWLYWNGSGVVDIYGNDGTPEKPFTISTAKQLLSFAYEVSGTDRKSITNNGNHDGAWNFAGKYVTLDADIHLQSVLAVDSLTHNKEYRSNLIEWIGIGSETNPFEGIFFGNGRHITHLYGQPFFGKIGDYAVVNKVYFSNLVEVHGCGVVAYENKGLICGINIEGDIKAAATEDYAGSIVGNNESFIVACTHVGGVELTGIGSNNSNAHVGGLVGRNNGTIIASYHSGPVKAPQGVKVKGAIGYVCDSKNTGENNSQAFSCYYNSSFGVSEEQIPGKTAYPRTTGQMQSKNFVDSETDIIAPEEGTGSDRDELAKHHCSLNKAMAYYKQWIDAIVLSIADKPMDHIVHTNCHNFTKQQVLWLQNHYNGNHVFNYAPGSYPKLR